MMTYRDSLAYSTGVLQSLRENLRAGASKDEIVAVCGSFSRGEASESSDIDYFTIAQADHGGGHTVDQARIEAIEKTIKLFVPKGPAEGGAFSKCHTREEMLRNIGGQEDSNNNITRRVLFLLEGNWLTGEEQFKELRHEILERYISSTITDHQLALFLLNDVIRYYRTMAVDYEFKTAEATKPKPWALRNIKLIFSRKLLYASGLFSVALTCDRRHEQKIAILEQLFDLPCLERLAGICGPNRVGKLIACYNAFLSCVSDPEKRAHLETLKIEERAKDPVFRDIKNEGHSFTRELHVLFESTFDSTHPIHRAVVF